ncbi:Ubiquitin domain-containing protein 1 [Trichinella pseudospiralis]|nr:Ubiquitin domain-containing protein 1 [Trichinella pseudospiralis]KRZ21229.1 Ubiquitin domain-containing protein 1 [Trichinella pseudospiralis]
MGACLGRGHISTYADDSENTIFTYFISTYFNFKSDITSNNNAIVVTIGKSRPLIQEKPKWKSEIPVTVNEVILKRKEFWETAPAFEGRKEIWDALKAAALQSEQGDFALAQAILDGACISLPDGTLRECYDELGNRYKIPLYCLSFPNNLVEERALPSEPSDVSVDCETEVNEVQTCSIKLRISSTGKDVRLLLKSTDSVLKAKNLLYSLIPDLPPPEKQRWFFGGKMLHDRALIKNCKIPPMFVIQVDASCKERNSPFEKNATKDCALKLGNFVNDSQLDPNLQFTGKLHGKCVPMVDHLSHNHSRENLPTPVDS